MRAQEFIQPIFLTVGIAVLSGCLFNPAAETRLTCDSGEELVVEWRNNDVLVTSAEGYWTLPQARSGSGARYFDGNYELWEHQGEFSWTKPGTLRTICKEITNGS